MRSSFSIVSGGEAEAARIKQADVLKNEVPTEVEYDRKHIRDAVREAVVQ
jgi:hypothetical protein